jgi:hypothetical protein
MNNEKNVNTLVRGSIYTDFDIDSDVTANWGRKNSFDDKWFLCPLSLVDAIHHCKFEVI